MSVTTLSFTAHDRCDRCGSQALAEATLDGFEPLLFCQHHKNEHEDALIVQGWTVSFDAETFEGYRTNQYQSAVH